MSLCLTILSRLSICLFCFRLSVCLRPSVCLSLLSLSVRLSVSFVSLRLSVSFVSVCLSSRARVCQFMRACVSICVRARARARVCVCVSHSEHRFPAPASCSLAAPFVITRVRVRWNADKCMLRRNNNTPYIIDSGPSSRSPWSSNWGVATVTSTSYRKGHLHTHPEQ